MDLIPLFSAKACMNLMIASGKVMVRICGVMALGIQNGNRLRKYFIRNMMVTNDEVYSFSLA